MAYAAVDAASLKAAPGPHPAASRYDKSIGAALGVHAFGVYQVELPPSAPSIEHHHLADGAEDLYVGISGSGKVIVDGEEVALRPGVFVAVTPDSLRFVQADNTGLIYLAVCG